MTGLMLLSFIMMVASSFIAGWSDITAGSGLKSDAAAVSPVTAYAWMVANCLSTAFFALMMRSKIKQVNFKDFDTVYYNNLLSIPVLLVFSALTEVGEFWRVYEKYTVGDGVGQLNGLVVSIILSSISSFAISYGSSWCVRVTSSTTYSMVGALNKLPISIFGMVLFDDAVTFGQVSGVIIAFVAGIVYSYSKNQQNLQKSKENPPLPLHSQMESNRDVLFENKALKD